MYFRIRRASNRVPRSRRISTSFCKDSAHFVASSLPLFPSDARSYMATRGLTVYCIDRLDAGEYRHTCPIARCAHKTLKYPDWRENFRQRSYTVLAVSTHLPSQRLSCVQLDSITVCLDPSQPWFGQPIHSLDYLFALTILTKL